MVRNPRHDSEFWYEDQESWKEDPILLLSWNSPPTGTQADDCFLDRLTDKGNWYSLQADGDQESWPVWWTDDKLKTEDRCIVFPAPCCHIVDNNGKAPKFELWFGVQHNDLTFDQPFLTIARPGASDDRSHRQLIWFVPLHPRSDDVLRPKKSNVLQLANWESDFPVDPDPKFSVGDVLPWLLEEITPDGERFSPIYGRQFKPAPNALPINPGTITIFQIARGHKASLFVRTGGIIPEVARSAWNQRTQKIADGLQAVAGALPVGIVPQITGGQSDGGPLVAEWETRNSISDCCRGETSSEGYDLIAAGFPANGVLADAVGATLSFPCLRGDGGASISCIDATLGAKQESSDVWVRDDGTLVQFLVKSFTISSMNDIGDMPIIRDGALSFKLRKVPPDSDLPPLTFLGRLRLRLQLVQSQRPLFLWRWFPSLTEQDSAVLSYNVEDFSLPVDQIDAAGEDLSVAERLIAPRTLGAVVEGAGERGSRPLVIPLGFQADQPENYLLTFNESVNVAQDHRFDVKVQEFLPSDKPRQSSLQAIVVDSNPQLLAKVECRFLQEPGFDDGAWILARRSPLSEEENGWELLDDQAETEGFRLVMPAQVIGEAYVKNKDAVAGEPVDDQPIDYRFAAPAILRLAPERLERRYVAVPWNLRRIWGKAGDAAPGYPLLEARFETNYGLTTYLEPNKGFLTELGAKLGEIPVPPVNSLAWAPSKQQQQSFNNAWNKYLDLYRAWQSRVAVLEASVDDDFANATFVDGVSFKPRLQIGLVEPKSLTYVKTAGANLRWPLAEPCPDTTVSEKEKDDAGAVLTAKIGAAHTSDGLAGGFHYGFESHAIYWELWREAWSKGSSSGEVKELAFSSVGAWARQTARFAQDKTAIKSNTAMGRTHLYAVERIGRIGVLWHKAKHVIEYERTVVPSKQFSDLPAHLGRTLVRKVREYIEILEPIRQYPDFAKDDVAAPGAVLSCTFKTKIMPVLSSWGSNVYAVAAAENGDRELIGWQVPLWKRGADPEVYPKPQIIVNLVPPPDSEEEAVLATVSEPDMLWFYTDTRDEAIVNGQKLLITGDVHAWPPIAEVDFTLFPDPQHNDIAPAAGDSPELLDAPLPPALDVPPGFERFTLRVDRTDIPAGVATRYFPESGVTGRLRTVTMMRSSGVDQKLSEDWWNQPPIDDETKKRRALRALVHGSDSVLAGMANGFSQLETQFRAGVSIKVEHFESHLAGIGKQLKDILQPISKPYVDSGKLEFFAALWNNGGYKKLSIPFQMLWREAVRAADSIVSQTKAYYDKQENSLLADLNAVLQTAGRPVTQAIDALTRFCERVTQFRLYIEFTVDSAFSSSTRRS